MVCETEVGNCPLKLPEWSLGLDEESEAGCETFSLKPLLPWTENHRASFVGKLGKGVQLPDAPWYLHGWVSLRRLFFWPHCCHCPHVPLGQRDLHHTDASPVPGQQLDPMAPSPSFVFLPSYYRSNRRTAQYLVYSYCPRPQEGEQDNKDNEAMVKKIVCPKSSFSFTVSDCSSSFLGSSK